jgi:hypothetical protein
MLEHADFPGHELVEKGLSDLRHGTTSAESLLVALAAPRLRRLGLAVPPKADLPPDPELSLYRFLLRAFPEDAYSRYNALLRRLISYEHCAERALAARW